MGPGQNHIILTLVAGSIIQTAVCNTLFRGGLHTQAYHMGMQGVDSTQRENDVARSTPITSTINGKTIRQHEVMLKNVPQNKEKVSRESTSNSMQDSGRRSTDFDCQLSPSETSVSKFRHDVYYNNLNFVYIRVVPSGNFSIGEQNYVVGGDIWVWTFYGKDGGFEFLDWPIEFEIWSMGLLTAYVGNPRDVTLKQKNGRCNNLVVGEKKTDVAIVKALVDLPRSLMNISTELKERYGPSFFCYKQRVFLNPKFFYLLCKHIVCPVESLKYHCCSNFFNVKKLVREVDCDSRTHKYDALWWVLPIVVAVVLFTFVPLFLMSYAWKLSNLYHKRNKRKSSLQNLASNEEPEDEIVYLDDEFPVTLWSTLWDPISNYCFKNCYSTSRLFRFFLPFFSLCFIALQLFLDSKYLHGFVRTSIKKGVPLGFRSMTAGYEKSRHNFMPLFGGPYVTLSVYLLITCLAITYPASLSDFLARGLQCRNAGTELTVALVFDLMRIERLGSVPVLRLRGFHRIYNTYLGQFYMLLNMKFWREVKAVLVDRWSRFAISTPRYVFFPFYVLFCAIEVFFCVAINGFPIISFAFTIIRAYSFFNIFRVQSSNMRLCPKILSAIVSIILVVVVLFFLYMFCTIFMDAILLITRLFMFTYTGIVIYPKLSYGYLIFSFTVFYYLWDCVRAYSMLYWRLLKITVSACEYVQRIHDRDGLVAVDNERRVKGVRQSIFEHVIETHCPRRKQVFVSLLKLLVILGIIGGSLGLLTKTDKFRELHVIMHIGTALFTCALPMILRSICRGPEQSYRNKRFEHEVRHSVADFVGYFEEYSSDTASE